MFTAAEFFSIKNWIQLFDNKIEFHRFAQKVENFTVNKSIQMVKSK